MNKFILAAFACLTFIGCTGAPTDDGGGNSNLQKTLDINFGGDVDRGKVLWEEKKCSQCHGKGLKQGTTWPLDMDNLKDTTPENLAEYIERTMPTFYDDVICVGQCAKDTAQLMIDWVNNPDKYLHTADEVETLACKNDVRVERPALTRLSPTEYANTLQDLFDLEASPDLSHFPVYEVDASFVYLDSVILAHSESYQKTAESTALLAVEKINLYADCQLEDNGCAHNYLRALAQRAFRGTPSTELMNLILSVNDSVTEASDAKYGVVAAVETILQSPYFLYRPSKAIGYADNGEAGDQFVNASRLSYLLTGRMPDNSLWSDALAGSLDKNRLLLHAHRLLVQDSTLEYLSKEFVARWFQAHKPASKRKNISEEDLKQATDDVLKFIRTTAWGNQGGLGRLLTDAGVVQNGVYKSDPSRIGILTQPAWLTKFAEDDRTKPISRGIFVAEDMLCRHVPIFDGMVEFPDPVPGLSLRERLERHREDPICAGCHALFDPMGLALENYDNFGQWRDEDEGGLIETSGLFATNGPTISFNDHAELLDTIEERDEVYQCGTKQWLSYAYRVVLPSVINCDRNPIVDQFKNGGGIESMILKTLEQTGFFEGGI